MLERESVGVRGRPRERERVSGRRRERERVRERERGSRWTRGGRRSPSFSQAPPVRRAVGGHGRGIWTRRGKGDLHYEDRRSEGDVSVASVDLAPDLESRFRSLKGKLHEGRSEVPWSQVGAAFGDIKVGDGRDGSDGRKRTGQKVTWADRGGAPLASSSAGDKGVAALSEGSSCWRGVGGSEVRTVDGGEQSLDRGERLSCGPKKAPRLSYKDALLSEQPKPSHISPSPVQLRDRPTYKPPPAILFNQLKKDGRCFRCFAKEHVSRVCREPVRCLRCSKPGHVARNCRGPPLQLPASMHRAMGFRPTSSKVFVPFSEGYFTREQQRQNAVLANVVGEARLGHFPQGVIANDLANRYGGFANDFMVARHWEKDFVLFLPVWVRPEDLFNRGTIRLASCRLSCFAWNPFRGAL